MLNYIIKGSGICLLAILLVALIATPVLAFDARGGNTVNIGSEEVIDDDLYIGADAIVINGTIDGDLWAAGRTVTVNGAINGGIVAAGQTISLNGDVAHSVRLGGTTISVTGDINGDLIVFGSDVNIDSTARIGGDIFVGAGNIHIGGLIEGDIKGSAGEVTISGEVGGDIALKVDNLTIASTADIEGNLTYTSEHPASVQPDAYIGGTTTHDVPEVEEPARAAPFSKARGKVLGFLMALVTGIVIILIAPRRSTLITDAIQSKPLPSLGWGAVVLFAAPVAAIILCVTVIGIPVGLIALTIYGIAVYLSQVFAGLFIGRWIIGHFREVESRAILIGALAAGLAILTILRLIPFLGFIIWLGTALFALGAVVVSQTRLRTEAQEVPST